MQWFKACLKPKVLIAIALVILAGYLFVPQLTRYAWLLLALACPISMMVMMAGLQHRHDHAHSPKQIFTCSECGLTYVDKEWAQKCQGWCQEHKSCNLEITKHSLPK